jgi:putative ABC transport system permease protein
VRSLSLAWRNLLRNRRRSLMTIVAMVLGLVTVLLFGGYVKDLTYGLQTDFVQLSGHLQVQHKDYFRMGGGDPAGYGVGEHERILKAIANDPELGPKVTVATPILQFGGLAGNAAAGVSRTVFVTGIVVEDQARMRQWNEHGFPSLAAHISLSGTPPDTAVVGTGVARVLMLCAELRVPDCAADAPAGAGAAAASAAAPTPTAGGELPADIADLAAGSQTPATAASAGRPRIDLLVASARGAPNVASVSVLAAEFQGIKEFDDVHVAMHLAQAQKLVFGAAPPKVTAIAVQLEKTSQLPAARVRLETLLREQFPKQPLTVLDYEVLNPFYGQALAMFGAIFGFIAVLIGAIVLFTVTNTMTTSVVERTAEIGTLRAIGVRRGEIRRMFIAEGLVLGSFSAVAGIGLALALAALINAVGLTWLPPGRVEPLPLALRVGGEWGMLAASAVGVIVLGALSALLPAARAARMNIVEALRHV